MRRGELGLGDDRLPERGLFDAYRVRAAAGQRIIVDLTSHEFDTFLVIESPSGDQETNDDYDMDTGHSHVQWIAPEDGTYKIVVTTFDPTGGGAYLLQLAVAEEEGVEEGRIEPQDTAAAASPSMVVTHQGRLGPEDELTPEGAYVDTYTVEATPGQTLNADLVSSDFDTYLIIEAPGGNRVANDDDPLDPGHSRLEVQVSEQGTYTVLVTSFSAGEAGDYILQVGVYAEP
jgi:hypothetical protein